ncbi:ribonuclease-3 family protein [Hydrogenispora ethanolica]|jgi:ribonuclease-3 family protein|uniref:Mini-ribonuclease 3 n=1 Tax=Hydrogenispora ethanolica TaxID=1082276 RepID=A0A4R1S679_HYDET|nr:ribonuclease III domain-containing protein [Hydrogenispora ethanolica]TCL74300.1 ribonuclease-3 family protein [Hydrogenispora ethanolica]
MIELKFPNLTRVNPDELSPAVWAYIGDAVYELFVRHQLVSDGTAKTQQLHKKAIARVRASYQADLVRRLEPLLSEREQEIVRRGRNVKSGHVPSGSDVLTYRYSTAFEALLGYLYLSGSLDRLEEILELVGAAHEGANDVKG